MNLSQIDLNLLHVLHVVLDERSVRRAAKRLGVTPPAVSNALRRLRELLDDPLLVRRGRGLVPTPHALALAPVLAESLGELERVVRGESFDPSATTRTFTIALADAEQLTVLPRLVRGFTEVMPRAHLRVVSVDVLVAAGGLGGTEVDLVIGPPAEEAEIRHEMLHQEAGTLVVRRDHPRIGARLTKKGFREERHIDVHIAMGRGGRGHAAAERSFAELGLHRDVAVTVPTFTAAAWLASATDLIAGIPRSLAETLSRTIPIRLLRGPVPSFAMPMAMSWHLRTDTDPGTALLREVVRDAFVG